jgi:micrococcal nuclease
LAYVWLGEPDNPITADNMRGAMFNARLLSKGYARLLTIPPNVRYADYFKAFQTEARDAKLGLWALDASKPTSAPPRAQQVASGYIGNIKSHVFHMPSCTGASEMAPKNRVLIKTRDEAVKEGYRPCGICQP